jgi:hypothetical protein
MPMRHATEAVLRDLVDRPAGVAESDRRHVAGCPPCLAALKTAVTNRGVVGAEVADALHRRPNLRRPAVATLATAIVLAGATTAAANEWVPILAAERATPVAISASELLTLPDLGDYGDLVVDRDADVHAVASAAAASAETGLDVPEVSELPRGVAGGPLYQVADEVSATFTLAPEPAPPPELVGTSVRLTAGPGVAAIWSKRGGLPSLIVGRAVAPSAASSGAPFESIRDHLISLSGVPDELAAQLRSFDADGSTVPLPVVSDLISTSSAHVGRVPATVLTTRDRTMAAVVWIDQGVVTFVAGSLDADEVLAVARELR